MPGPDPRAAGELEDLAAGPEGVERRDELLGTAAQPLERMILVLWREGAVVRDLLGEKRIHPRHGRECAPASIRRLPDLDRGGIRSRSQACAHRGSVAGYR